MKYCHDLCFAVFFWCSVVDDFCFQCFSTPVISQCAHLLSRVPAPIITLIVLPVYVCI